MRIERSVASYAFLAFLMLVRVGAAQVLAEVEKLEAPSPIEKDWYGFAVTIDGETLVSTARMHDGVSPGNPNCDSGAAFVYELSADGVWTFVKMLEASDGACGNGFGNAAAVDGETLVVGADLSDAGGTDAGAAYVFERNEGGTDNWGEVRKLVPLLPSPESQFGSSISLDGDRLVVGSVDHSLCPPSVPGCSHGAAFVFERHAGGTDNWGEVKKIVPQDVAQFDYFGNPSLSGDLLAVSSIRNDEPCPPINPACNAGAIYLFQKDAGGVGNWGQVEKLWPQIQGSSGDTGWSLELSPPLLVAGTRVGDGVVPDTGSATVWELQTGGEWQEIAKLYASSGQANDWFGESVGIWSGSIVVGARFGSGTVANTGAAWVFDRDPGTGIWVERLRLEASDGEDGDLLAADGDADRGVLVLGSRQDDGACPTNPECNSGSAAVFHLLPFLDGFESGHAGRWSSQVVSDRPGRSANGLRRPR